MSKISKQTKVAPPQNNSFFKAYGLDLGIFIFALITRLVYFFAVRNSFLFNNPILDSRYYYDWALEIIKGDWLSKSQGVFVMSPGYSYLLAVIFKFFGISVSLPVILQILCGCVSAVLVYRIARFVVRTPYAAAAGIIFAAYDMALFYDLMLLKSSVYQLAGLGAVYLFMKQMKDQKSLPSLLIGLLIGFSVQLRPYAVLLAALVGCWCAYSYITRKKNIYILQGLLLFAGFCATTAPVALRNYAVGGELVFSTAHGGMNFYTGNNPQAKGPYTPLPFARTDPQYEQNDFYEQALRLSGRNLNRHEADNFWYARGFDFIREHTRDWLKLTAKKILIFVNGYEPPINIDYYFFRDLYKLSGVIPLIPFALIFPFGAVGLMFLWNRSPESKFLALYGVLYAASNIALFVTSEYRYPAVPVFIIFGVALMSRMIEDLKLKNIRRFALSVLLVSLIGYLSLSDVYANILGFRTYKRANLANAYFGLGVTYESKGMFQEAFDAYAASLRVMPQDASLINLSRMYADRNELAEAERLLKEALRIKPVSFEAHNNLGSIYYKQCKFKDAYKEFEAALSVNPDADLVKQNLKKTAEAMHE